MEPFLLARFFSRLRLMERTAHEISILELKRTWEERRRDDGEQEIQGY